MCVGGIWQQSVEKLSQVITIFGVYTSVYVSVYLCKCEKSTMGVGT